MDLYIRQKFSGPVRSPVPPKNYSRYNILVVTEKEKIDWVTPYLFDLFYVVHSEFGVLYLNLIARVN